MSSNINYEHILDLQAIIAATIESGATDAIVAGGAVRDMLLGKPIKDIDVFYTGDLDQKKVYQHFKKLGDLLTEEELDDLYGDSDWQVTQQALRYEDVEYPVQLIRVNGTLDDHIATFGVGISKVMVDANGLVIPNEFLSGMAWKILSFGECGDTYKNKMIEKFPDYECSNA
jgi:hypothetical protein